MLAVVYIILALVLFGLAYLAYLGITKAKQQHAEKREAADREAELIAKANAAKALKEKYAQTIRTSNEADELAQQANDDITKTALYLLAADLRDEGL